MTEIFVAYLGLEIDGGASGMYVRAIPRQYKTIDFHSPGRFGDQKGREKQYTLSYQLHTVKYLNLR
jgi:hypothetical protein